jgi:hypothetical protein
MVRRLVQQHDVKARDSKRRQPGSRGLPTRQRVKRAVDQLGLQAQVRERCAQARLDVGAAEVQPALERSRVRLHRIEVTRRQRGGPAVERAAGSRQPDAVHDDLAHGTPPILAVGELREVADRAEAPDDAVVGVFAAGEYAKQR